MPERLLSLDKVTAGYAQDIDVLRDVSLDVHAGEVSGLIGLNGAGKSTVVKTICGFLAPKEGSVRFRGEDISGLPPHTLIDHGICCIPQESSLFPYLTVEENLLLPLQGRARQYGAVLRQRYEQALDEFPTVREKRKAQAGDLSGGQQKQVEFAKAWLQQPMLCLIDEPSIGLSPLLAESVFTWIEKFAQSGMGILLIDHNVRRVVRMSDRVHVLSLGRITAAGQRKDFEGDLHEQVKQWLGLNF
ncbi:amino acid/amide ABC transporter ATP-binding protein 2, HAAT family [Noviherbaspirillum humi]|uniref:Amino acid/amide ABC transporter ATP-binding protein 2, HAAT family n=1 Tax=Noviherbaspirillum humi TaxID=1688639 RepID=A0A239LM66_9BURK|nr:ABC transporter ATP-binding protein [Noviherbaspirillum humi]SNT30968.1 amino acid/amide ABC transporter ATP-binding protein 2, HAAT family [Noviherbaspirillum humi]